MAFTRTWDAAYEAIPANSEQISLGAQRMREIKLDARERIEIDHSMAGDADDGKHKQITLVDPLAAKPTQSNDESYVYSKDVSGTSELFYEDESGNEVQLTQAGSALAFAAGTRMLFQQTAAPTGWTKETNSSYNNVAMRIVTGTISTGGSQAFTTCFATGRTSSSNGAHTHTYSGTTSAASQTSTRGNDSNGPPTAHTHTYSGTTSSNGAHTHTVAMDVKYYDMIIAQKD